MIEYATLDVVRPHRISCETIPAYNLPGSNLIQPSTGMKG